MKRFFDFTIIKSVWTARLQTIFESIFGKPQPKIENPPILSQKNTPTATQNPVNPTKREMHSSTVAKAVALRKPMIKFVGARLPRPFFDASALPPLQVSGHFPSVSAPKPTASSIGPVGKIPRGHGIDATALPLKFRRHGLSDDEIEAVNTGFFYQR
ncbi:unnamed protein product [Caenorhabditis sp. 36 PRJEB53466]|nr:unnamed protein product [Caenorhabditis sp. 36 PRJEB53466]